ncbi:MAG: hypothetical protein A2Z31_08450 [candidate division NC10 bacterium RBG_16_65_8]|nr:MAG: hypothetical protein A2Z31_08450 [candidate division NC10 bacterium RBG_16_65_8]
MPKTKHATDVRREQIVEAAMKLIANRGTRGTTTKAIAEECGISEGALYRHIESRDRILSLVVDRIGAGLTQNLRQVERTADTPLDQVEALFLGQVTFLEEHRGIPRLAFSEDVHLHRPDLRIQMAINVEVYFGRIRALAEAGKRTGCIRPDVSAETVATMLVGTIQALSLRWSLSGFRLNLSERALSAWEGLRALIAAKATHDSRHGS